MSLVGFRANNHPHQVNRRGPDDAVDDRGTAPDTFDECVGRWGPFTLDVAAAPHNAKCDRFFTIADDGLAQSWAGESVWCNPPYSGLASWVEKATLERTAAVTMLLPANRTEQRWWQDWIEPVRDRGGRVSTSFLRSRRRFILPGATTVEPNQRPPFGLVVVHFRREVA